jgi:tryptophan synthase alpha chain
VSRAEEHLRARRDEGAKILSVYVTAGLPGWQHVLEAVVAGGADAVELGIPFSDPIMDGPVIQQASADALAAGATMGSILAETRALDVDVPLIGMTYYNLVARLGHERAANELASVGISGMILPDLQFDELGDWPAVADAHDIATVLLAAPTTPDDRLQAIAERSRGFLYAVSLLGVTGERDRLADEAVAMGRRCKAVTDLPVLLGVGISNAEQAAGAAAAADGVVVGSALMRRVLAGAGPEELQAFVAELRAGLDA